MLQEFTELETDYWYEVDHNYGRKVGELYVSDGIFAIGSKEMKGREAIAEFYRWRESRGDRTARHVVTNFRMLSHAGDKASFCCVMCLYAADGRPVLPSLPAIMIADIVSDCVRNAEGRWQYVAHRLIPIFEGGVPATIPPET
jgi:hypothetical protein